MSQDKVDLNQIYLGNCLEVMATWPENFIDTIVTDPPYGLEFMGKDWDGDVPGVHFWQEMIRVSKPGASLLAFGGTRTWHHLAMAIEKAGWQIRDCLMWLYGSGFPKSLDISKAIDKAAGHWRGKAAGVSSENGAMSGPNYERTEKGEPVTATATATATAWNGYGTALKPAWEPIIVAMKPTDGTFAENAEKWGVAGINVDGGRIATTDNLNGGAYSPSADGMSQNDVYGKYAKKPGQYQQPEGRWPANLLLDEEAAGMLDGQSGLLQTNSGHGEYIDANNRAAFGKFTKVKLNQEANSGGASRFFYVAKADRAERNEGCDGMPQRRVDDGRQKSIDNPFLRGETDRRNTHPTVKPLSLMKYLCQLTRTPTGGIVLDPFAGSGTTLWAAEYHNRPWIGIEMNPEYVAIANARIARERAQMKMAI